MLKQGSTKDQVDSKCGSAAHIEAVRRLQSEPSPESMTPQQFHAKQVAERREYFRNRSTQGIQAQRVSRRDHNYIVDRIFNSVHAGTRPAVRPMLEAYGKEHNRAPEWAERVAAQTHAKKMGKTLAAKKDHPVLQDLKGGNMLSQTHKSTLQNATYSGLATLLFSGSQNVREKRALQQRMDALEAELAAIRAEAARANARLDLKDSGQDWKERARAILAVEPNISKRELARRVDKDEKSIRKYLQDIKGDVVD